MKAIVTRLMATFVLAVQSVSTAQASEVPPAMAPRATIRLADSGAASCGVKEEELYQTAKKALQDNAIEIADPSVSPYNLEVLVVAGSAPGVCHFAMNVGILYWMSNRMDYTEVAVIAPFQIANKLGSILVAPPQARETVLSAVTTMVTQALAQAAATHRKSQKEAASQPASQAKP